VEQNAGLCFPVSSFTSGFNSPKHIIMQLLVVGKYRKKAKEIAKNFYRK